MEAVFHRYAFENAQTESLGSIDFDFLMTIQDLFHKLELLMCYLCLRAAIRQRSCIPCNPY